MSVRVGLLSFLGAWAMSALGTLLFGVCFWWMVGNAATSTVKAFAGDCGKRYPVETIFYGSWFCPEVADDANAPTGR